VRREARAVAKRLETREELVALVKALWSAPVHERRAAAAFLLEARVDLLDPTDLPRCWRPVCSQL
jgi:hypothetical protein